MSRKEQPRPGLVVQPVPTREIVTTKRHRDRQRDLRRKYHLPLRGPVVWSILRPLGLGHCL